MNAVATAFGYFVAVALATVLSAFAAVSGAKFGGLMEGGWNWQFLPPFGYGGVFGLIMGLTIAALSDVFSAKTGRFPFTIIVPPVCAFLISAMIYFIIHTPQRKYAAEYRRTRDALKAEPLLIHSLIAKAQEGTLSQAEKSCLWDAVFRRQNLTSEEIFILIEHFKNDGSALGGIISKLNVTPEHLRLLYQQHNNTPQSHRVIMELLECDITPQDVLAKIAESSQDHHVRKANKRLKAIQSSQELSPND